MGMTHASEAASVAATGWVRRQATGSVVASATSTPTGRAAIG